MKRSAPKLEWLEKYSVGVIEIDNQNKLLFKTINELIDLLHTDPSDEDMKNILGAIIDYKKIHFATEEKYFKEFNFEGTAEHVAEHDMFTAKVLELQTKNSSNTLEFAYELVDYLEDWLISHLMNTDQKYIECFKSHGLK